MLIIDDDADMLASLVTLLDAYGFCVLTASNGVRGLQVMQGERSARGPYSCRGKMV